MLKHAIAPLVLLALISTAVAGPTPTLYFTSTDVGSGLIAWKFYIDCDDGSTAEVDCVAGSPASSNGLPGCCSTGTALGRDGVEATRGCGGIGSSEDSRIYLHVRRGATAPAGCGPYLLEFGG